MNQFYAIWTCSGTRLVSEQLNLKLLVNLPVLNFRQFAVAKAVKS